MAEAKKKKGWSRQKKALAVLAGLTAAAVLGGGKKKGGARRSSLLKVIALAGKTVTRPEREEEEMSSRVEGDVRWQTVTHDDSKNVETVTYLGQNDDVIWPGSLVRGTGINDFVYRPILVSRAPLTLSVNLETSALGKALTERVKDPKLSTVRQGISNLLSRALTGNVHVPARVDFSYEEVFSESDMSAYIGADISTVSFELSSAFDWSSTAEKTRIVAKYQQIFYSIDVDIPNSPAGWFARGVTPEQLAKAMPKGSQPVFVASVAYGMMAFLLIESNYSKEIVEASLDAAYEGVVVDVDVATETSARKVLDSSRIKTVVYGGATAGLKRIEEGLEGFLEVIHTSSEFSSETPGVPLTYKFRDVEGSRIAKVALTSQYSERVPFMLRRDFRVTFIGLQVLSTSDETGSEIELDVINVQVWAWNVFEPSKTGPVRASQKALEREQLITPKGGLKVYRHSGSEIDLATGGRFPLIEGALGKASADLRFNTRDYEIGQARLKVECYAHEVDSPWLHDEARGSTPLRGWDFMACGAEACKFHTEISAKGLGRLLFTWSIQAVERSF